MDYKNKIMEYEIIHQPEQNLFKTEVDGRTAFVQYRLLGDSLDIIHTIVPRPIEGRGIAATLVKAAYDCTGQRYEAESYLLVCGKVVGAPPGTG